MQKIDKPWGHEIIWASTNNYVGKEIFIKKGHRLSKQYHREKEETIYILDGSLTLELGEPIESVAKLTKGTSFHLQPGTIHRMIADINDVKLCEVSTPQIADIVRLQDDYGRT